jgi:carbamoyltransferase
VTAGVTDLRCVSPMLGPREVESDAGPNALTAAVEALSRGEIIGLISGGVEFGPRALGARCLLADARRADAKDRLNTMKGRPDFMPLAPAVRAEDAERWFEGVVSSNMAWTVRFRSGAEVEFPGMGHPSGETRAQAVDARQAPLLYRLLDASARAGNPILLLTSLNGPGDPVPASVHAGEGVAQSLGAAGSLTDRGWVAHGST